MAHLFDPVRTFNGLKKAIIDGVEKTFPIETNKRILRVSNVRVDDSKVDPFDYAAQKEIKVQERDYVAPVFGDVQLIDKETGKVIDEKKKFRLMDVPALTDRYSFILGGNEYTVDKQLRMKPGIYTREKENGELESQFNLAKGGRGFKMIMNPEDNIFKLKIQSSFPPLYPILKALGIEDGKIREAWGESLFKINQAKTEGAMDSTVLKVYKSIFGKSPAGISEATFELRKFFEGTVLSEETTKRTLGEAFASVSPDALLATSKKLLKVSRGEDEPDDRDSLIYKNIYDAPDLIATRIEKSRRKIQYDASRVMDRKNKVTEIVSKDMLNKPVRSFFTQGSNANVSEQVNPTAILAEATKVTSLGEGAISDLNAVTESMRAVNPSHAGVLDPIATPESDKIGLNLHLALGADIQDKELRTLVRDVKTGQSDYKNVSDLFDSVLAFPDQYDAKGKPVSKKVRVLKQGKISLVDPKEVNYVMRSPKQMFTYATNLVPFTANIQGNRAFMANKMLAQALPLKYREEPLVQNKLPAGKGTFERFIGRAFSVSADQPGEVLSVSDDKIIVKNEDGSTKEFNLYNNLPLNNKAFVTSEARVKAGDKIKPGQVLADSSFTKDGALAIGTNLKVAYIPFRSNTFEDGYVISESGSKKLTSEHLREVKVQTSREDRLDLKSFRAHYPTAMNAAMAAKLDADGVIKKGELLEPGDIVIAHLQKLEALPEDAKLGKLSKRLVKGYRNNAQIWDKDTVGRVVDVYKTSDGVKVFVRTEDPAQIGDKLVNRHGAKGIISTVIPDEEMPRTKDGTIVDVIVSPSTIPSRINPSQVLENAAGKVARKWGRPLKIDNFQDINSVEEIKRLIKSEGIEDKEELIDPSTGNSMGKVNIGDQYYLKLIHQVDKKINARGAGPGYDIDLQPTKGGEGSARNLGRLEFNSLIAHGARENLHEMTAYKAEQNPELWRNVQLGLPLPASKTPFVVNKLMGYLAAGGVNIRKEGNSMFMLPLTDRDTLERSNGAIEEAKVVVAKNLRPVKDGLFDEVKTGGLKGTKWTHIQLAEPILNPVMENAAKTLLDLTGKDLDKIIDGSLYYDPKEKKLTEDSGVSNLTSGSAIKKMLSEIDVDSQFNDLKEKAKSLKGQGLDKANKKLRYLRALKQFKMRPEEAYVVHNVPVLPPQFRPMYPLPNGNLNTAPVNFLYRDLSMVNGQLKELKDLPDDLKADLRKDVYQAVKALQGLGDPLVQRGEKKLAGAIELIKGAQPKTGYYQSVVFSKNQDLSGSSTVTPSTEMSPDEIMLPRDMAWSLYEPFAVREMVRMGYKPLDAKVAVRNRAPQANMALEVAVKNRPVWINRAPSLHKFSILAVQPKLYDGKSIKVHPLIVGGFNMDFDGDSAGLFVPISHKAVEEARQFMPSRVLEHAADNRIMLAPKHDVSTGLYYLTKTGKDLSSKKKYETLEDALKDYKTKSVEIFDFVTIGGKKTTMGMELVGKHLPEGVSIPSGGLTKSTTGKFLKDLAAKGPDQFRDSMDQLSKLATKYNQYSGISIGLEDITPEYSSRDKLISTVKTQIENSKNDDDRRKIVAEFVPKVESLAKTYMAANPDNALVQLAVAGGKPSVDQFKQTVLTPFAVSDELGRAVPFPITKSFPEGLPVSEYWAHTYGSRSGVIQKRLSTAEPGYFAKQIISVSVDNVVSQEDCGTKDGVVTEITDPNDVIGRYEAGTNTLVTQDVFRSMLQGGRKQIKLRSPLTCEAKEGVCSKCYGLRENGQNPKIGDNVGALAGQFFSEPGTQETMRAFHTGAVLGSGAKTSEGLERLQQLTLVPKFLRDKATLAAKSGKIEKVEDNPGGGKNVYIDGEKHLVGTRNRMLRGVGDKVEVGEAITDGPIKPQELLVLKGIRPTQNYLVESMKDTLKGMGVNMNRKLLETLVRSTTNLTEIEDPGNHPYYVPGDKAPLTEVLNWNKDTTSELDLNMAEGAALAGPVGPYSAGTVLDSDKIRALRVLKIDRVPVRAKPISHTPSIVGVDVLARLGRDWLAKMNTNHIEKIIVEGVQSGDVSSAESYNPTGPYALATGFGKKKDGRY